MSYLELPGTLAASLFFVTILCLAGLGFFVFKSIQRSVETAMNGES